MRQLPAGKPVANLKQLENPLREGDEEHSPENTRLEISITVILVVHVQCAVEDDICEKF